ncbi:nucleotidyltransferase [Spirochaetia bacterium]|nr:nucleotidyltransferase [Spirochaetia bacterium]
MKGPILVVLAAGMGSRYGGLKQMDQIGTSGEVLLDYSVFDAKRAGFEKIVFIIRHDIEKDFNEIVLRRIGNAIHCETAFQELDSLIPPDILAESRKAGRSKPWGTSHALLCAKDKIDGPFAIINADDFYGHASFAVMGKYLKAASLTSDQKSAGAIVPYSIRKTLSPQGTVTRGVCEIANGCLTSVDELKAIAREGNTIYNTAEDGSKRELGPDTPVSMNFWGFPATIFPALQRYFDEFLKTSGTLPKSECYLPMAADWFIKNKLLTIKVLEADSEWFGVTYKEDRESAVRRIAELVSQGVYPASLWKN